MLGHTVFTLLKRDHKTRQLKVPALDGHTVTAASYDDGVLMASVQATNATRSLRVRIADDGSRDKLWLDDDIHHLPDFITLSNGTVVQRNSDANLALFSKQPRCNLLKVVRDACLSEATSLCHSDDGIALIRDKRVLQLTLRN